MRSLCGEETEHSTDGDVATASLAPATSGPQVDIHAIMERKYGI